MKCGISNRAIDTWNGGLSASIGPEPWRFKYQMRAYRSIDARWGQRQRLLPD
jgi:hypothetical protein